MNNDENAKLKDEFSALQMAYDELKKDRDDWERIADERLKEIRRLREVIRDFNKNTDSLDE